MSGRFQPIVNSVTIDVSDEETATQDAYEECVKVVACNRYVRALSLEANGWLRSDDDQYWYQLIALVCDWIRSNQNLQKLILCNYDGSDEHDDYSVYNDETTGRLLDAITANGSLQELRLLWIPYPSPTKLQNVLCSSQSLTSLLLARRRKPTCQHMMALSRGLMQNTSIKNVILGAWCAQNDDADFWNVATLAEGLTVNTSIKKLVIDTREPLDGLDLDSFGRLIRNKRSLETVEYEFNVPQEEHISIISVWSALSERCCPLKQFKIDISVPHPNFGHGLRSLLQCNSSLKELRLKLHRIPEDWEGPALSTLIANGLLQNNTLKVLSVNYTIGRTDFDGSAWEATLSQNTSLQKLHLLHCGVNDDVMIHLGKGLSKNETLQELDLSHNVISGLGLVGFAEHIEYNHHLAKLALVGCNINSRAVGCLLRRSSSIKELDIHSNLLGIVDTAMVAQGLMCNPVLDTLNLQFCGLSPVDCASVLQALVRPANTATTAHGRPQRSTNCPLRILYLQVAPEHKRDNHGPLFDALYSCLRHNSTLKELTIEKSKLTNDELIRIGEALTTNETLELLDYPAHSMHDYDSEGVHNFISLLPQMKGLRSIELLDHFAGADRHNLASTLCKALKDNYVLCHVGRKFLAKLDGERRGEVDWYLRMNRYGRRLLHSDNDLPTGIWAIIFAKLTRASFVGMEERSCLFYHLVSKPDLFSRVVV